MELPRQELADALSIGGGGACVYIVVETMKRSMRVPSCPTEIVSGVVHPVKEIK